MTPLKTFLETAKQMAIKPIEFWPVAEQNKALANIQAAARKLETILEKKSLTDTRAYQAVSAVASSAQGDSLSEMDFIIALSHLVDVYKHAPAPEETAKLIDSLDKAVGKAKPRIMEHHLSLEHLLKRAKKMTEEQKLTNDRDIIQKVGVFYILEYTLQVQFEFSYLSDEDKIKLLKEGLKVKAGSLPAYYPLEDTFRKELCYKIFDDALRHSLLIAFYKSEEKLYSTRTDEIAQGLKEFNLALLRAFEAKGMKTFKGLVYTPFGNNISVQDLIKNII